MLLSLLPMLSLLSLLLCSAVSSAGLKSMRIQSSLGTNANDYECCPVCVALDYSQLQSPSLLRLRLRLCSGLLVSYRTLAT